MIGSLPFLNLELLEATARIRGRLPYPGNRVKRAELAAIQEDLEFADLPQPEIELDMDAGG
ncbi:hypothetical protein FY133_26470 (plasmid) [Agrobacterium tumefaciens]|uniref:Uncharacterized protein n=2 Tax=Rhizobium/Agrobacterium group TaxID=227290 RepID=A0A2Z2PLU9_AGRTU|nr:MULTISPECIES: hypothetical protein [Rhizobium/Agrobacterium group]ASK41014.1 hypothetical protein [Rhizobium rhizogenes]ASK41184.1 hypothetical protein [Agrobacterium tumefaciens]ASK41819.1 hypothetical protein [Agrobacterium tumefaciens]MDJ1637398.1 hypothetical protein [Rhizobium rhizogenes]MDR5010970.1 hypothetical protein [Agrobacterium tumefaciens]